MRRSFFLGSWFKQVFYRWVRHGCELLAQVWLFLSLNRLCHRLDSHARSWWQKNGCCQQTRPNPFLSGSGAGVATSVWQCRPPSRSSPLSVSSNALRAAIAILSFCPATKLTRVMREVFRFSHEVTASYPLCSVRLPRRVLIGMFCGFVVVYNLKDQLMGLCFVEMPPSQAAILAGWMKAAMPFLSR